MNVVLNIEVILLPGGAVILCSVVATGVYLLIFIPLKSGGPFLLSSAPAVGSC